MSLFSCPCRSERQKNMSSPSNQKVVLKSTTKVSLNER